MKFVLFVTLIWSILDSGWSITDEEYIQFKAGLTQIQFLTKEVQDLRNKNQAGRAQIQVLTRENNQLRSRMDQLEIELTESRDRVDHLEIELSENRDRVTRPEQTCGAEVLGQDLAQNMTIEERVTILEGEMTIVQGEVAEHVDEIAFLFDEQVIQDERIYDLEQDTEDLDTRVEVLEANGGGGENVTALEERVETLEGTAAKHEADIEDLDSATSNLDGRVETLVGETSEMETRLTAAETQIEDLQATDAEFDARISDLEEGGGGGATNGTTIVFRAVMDETDDDNIPTDSTVIFSDVQLNEGNGYDPATGVFTVPSGGEGYYYFASYFTTYNSIVYIDIRVNGAIVCTMHYDTTGNVDYINGGCNAVVLLSEGDEVQNVYWAGTDSTPVAEVSIGVYNGFTGFRI